MKRVAKIAAPKTPIFSLKVAADGGRAVGLGFNFNVEPMRHEACVWDLEAGSFKVTSVSYETFLAVALASDGATLVARQREKTVALALPSGKVTRELPWPSGPGALSPAELLSVQAVDDGIALFDADKQLWAFADKAYSRWTGILWATPASILVGSQYPKKTLSVHDAKDGRLIVRNAVAQISESLWLAPGGARLVTMRSTTTPAILIDVATGATLKRPLLKTGLVSFAFSPTGAALAAADADGQVVFFGADVTKKVGELSANVKSPVLAWLPDGKTLLVVDGETGALEKWDVSELSASAPAPTLAEALGGAKAAPANTTSAKAPAKVAAPKVDVRTRGSFRIELTRPASTLAQHLEDIVEVLGHALPKDVAAFYEQGDGVRYIAKDTGKSLGVDETLNGVVALFDDFKPHRQFRTAVAYEKAQEDGALDELPFCDDTWSEDFEIRERGALAHLNALVRSKQLVRIAGKSEAIVVDFAPPAPKGKKAPPYQLGLAYRGAQFFPLELTFDELVEKFEKFGATSWLLAYLTPAALKEWNIDPLPTIEADMPRFAKAFPEEVAAVVARAKKRPR
jgi:hypothetical protein